MKTKRIAAVLFFLTAVSLSVYPVPALSQEQPADNMQLVREKMHADKKLFVAENMQLTEPEAKAFWPVYDRYQHELDRLLERTSKLYMEYSKNYETLSDETAKKLVDDALAIEEQRLQLKRSYLPEFRAVLPEKKVARYYQLENKIQAATSYELATRIPLVK